jgi:hypothetical protein
MGLWGDLSAQDLQKEVESATTMLYKWLLKAKSCAVALSKNTITWKKLILPGITMEKLAVYGQGLCGASTLACHVLCRQRK